MLRTLTEGLDTAHPPILIAHGLFGSARNWGVIAKRLSDTRRVIMVDMRNHGESPWTDSHAYPDLAEDLAEVIAANGGQADVLGHSMGGKAAMALSLLQSSAVRRLIVADIAPVAYGHTQQHLIDAMRAIDLSRVETRGDADRQLAVHVQTAGVRAFLLQSLDVKAKKWRLNLDVLERFMPEILGWPDLPGAYDGPALFLSGAESDYVKPEHRPTIKTLFPSAKFAKIPGAGHWLHADRPREFEATIRAFFGAGD
ncbi:alpha/beta fold hydrolase [Roseicyclus marinus]|uniref:alpha/beta fold hydrolase n=1 Tax=Roseicyclus marinus TaxID=2161673 RepID=UPI00240F6B78|nr:alpha/beta fold hydrolase [Roseicyclus marinus]MDG3041881.1 alpha/beta fold hydrolase [Roseicyclus marinus]